MMRRKVILALLALFIPFLIYATPSVLKKDTIPLKYGAHYIGKRHDAAMDHWRDMRFGEFIHFGLYSLLGGSWNGKHYNGAAEWIKAWAHIPDSAYFPLIHQFNPTKLDPEKWASLAKEMGVKYVRITTKHHEGFCLWPSKYTDFDISSTPYKKDLLGALIDAFNKQGIDVSLYYSILDWHHPDYRTSLKSKADSVAYARYKKYLKNQLTELLTRYPSVIGLWFDGTWYPSWEKDGKYTYDLMKYLKGIHPGLIINSRFRADDKGKRHFDSNGRLMGDYASGWERSLPPISDKKVTHYDWEGIMTIPVNQWGYNKIWNGHVKQPMELEEMLAYAVSMGGNFMINFGPKGDGTFRKEEKNTAKVIGNWMKINGKAIYGCDYAKGWTKQDWGYYTEDTAQQKVYMIVFNPPVSGNLRVKLPKNVQIIKNYPLVKPSINLQREEIGKDEYFIRLYEKEHPQPFVIVLQIKDTKKASKNHYQQAKT